MIIRIEPELKNKVSSLAKAEGRSTSEIVRELLTDYVRNRDIGAYIDGLWDRIGMKLSSRGVSQGQIEGIIKEVRSRK